MLIYLADNIISQNYLHLIYLSTKNNTWCGILKLVQLGATVQVGSGANLKT